MFCYVWAVLRIGHMYNTKLIYIPLFQRNCAVRCFIQLVHSTKCAASDCDGHSSSIAEEVPLLFLAALHFINTFIACYSCL